MFKKTFNQRKIDLFKQKLLAHKKKLGSQAFSSLHTFDSRVESLLGAAASTFFYSTGVTLEVRKKNKTASRVLCRLRPTDVYVDFLSVIRLDVVTRLQLEMTFYLYFFFN